MEHDRISPGLQQGEITVTTNSPAPGVAANSRDGAFEHLKESCQCLAGQLPEKLRQVCTQKTGFRMKTGTPKAQVRSLKTFTILGLGALQKRAKFYSATTGSSKPRIPYTYSHKMYIAPRNQKLEKARLTLLHCPLQVLHGLVFTHAQNRKTSNA